VLFRSLRGLGPLVGTALVFVVARPMRLILAPLCPSIAATAFWIAFTAAMLSLTTLVSTALHTRDGRGPAPIDVGRSSLGTLIVGGIAAPLVGGCRVSRDEPRKPPANCTPPRHRWRSQAD